MKRVGIGRTELLLALEDAEAVVPMRPVPEVRIVRLAGIEPGVDGVVVGPLASVFFGR
jgi:hypothetical protein